MLMLIMWKYAECVLHCSTERAQLISPCVLSNPPLKSIRRMPSLLLLNCIHREKWVLCCILKCMIHSDWVSGPVIFCQKLIFVFCSLSLKS
jgi:hypothetical protein